MSRIAAYIGSSLALSGFLTEPENSLFKQAVNPSSKADLSILTGGYGVGWYNPINQAARYLSLTPMWADPNLPALVTSLRRRIWLGFTRSGVNQFSSTPENSMPLHDDRVLFVHDGYVDDFRRTLRPHCLRYLSTDIESEVSGHTDSEYLFALLRQRMLESDGVNAKVALAEVMATLEVTLRDVEAKLNIIISDGNSLYAVRHATNTACAPLYYSCQDPAFPTGSQLIASSPLTSQSKWIEIPPHHLLMLTPEQPADLVRL